ncbi:hypothetical protein FDP41_001017 [Naegleria fowleri]|uniref:Uncharacterized protein n=1 Tax=Naegleria fowleri TaxID=5763 RepID=A0A6A5BZV9_NAEFO|nr:uncharacterized protein FDP41_001017 [Naegleria fowleri]KAF0979864.1 hypothetical protein FDP41_001017 [Naegleria fowleri]
MSNQRSSSLSSSPHSLSAFSNKKTIIVILLLVTAFLYFIASSFFSREGEDFLTSKHLVSSRVHHNDLQFIENHDLIRKKWMKSKRLSVVDDWQDDYMLDFTNAKIYPVTFLDLEPVEENANIGRMKALCKLYLFSYFTFNTRESSKDDFIIPTVIGAESDKSETFTPYTHWKKVEKLHEFLNSPESKYIRPHDYIMFSDATDVFFVNNIKKSKEIFENYYMKQIAGIDLENDAEKRWPIVFCAEKNRWPPDDFMQNMFAKTEKEEQMVSKHYYDRDGYFIHQNCDRSNQRIYLNSGFMMGRKRDFIEMLHVALTEVTLGEPKPRIEDQALYQYMHATQKYPFLTDCEAKLVYSPFSVCENVKSDSSSEWGCSLTDSPHRPFALHSNGGLCPSVCTCLRTIHESRHLKQNIEKQLTTDFAIHSYHVGMKTTKRYPLMPVCGKYLDEQYPASVCNR